MTLGEMRRLLDARNLKLTKSLGQNFLHDGNQLRRILDAAELSPSDRVLEIGPGLGPLTAGLLERAGQVLAIEKDGRLTSFLRERFQGNHSFELIEGDALDVLEKKIHDWSDWKCVSNLPYSVASPILVELALGAAAPLRIVATLQWEVGERIAAQAGEKEYGLLSLLIQHRYRPTDRFKISAGCFFPEPDVDSVCLTLVRRDPPLVPLNHLPLFVELARRSFSQRRKKMLKLLKGRWDESLLRTAFLSAGIDPDIRAEKVTVEQFARLAAQL